MSMRMYEVPFVQGEIKYVHLDSITWLGFLGRAFVSEVRGWKLIGGAPDDDVATFTRLVAIRRQRKGPPAPILARMSPGRRKMDKVTRSLSEVGYVALVERKLDRKLKDPEAGLELGEKENRPLLDKAGDMIRRENKRRTENDVHRYRNLQRTRGIEGNLG